MCLMPAVSIDLSDATVKLSEDDRFYLLPDEDPSELTVANQLIIVRGDHSLRSYHYGGKPLFTANFGKYGHVKQIFGDGDRVWLHLDTESVLPGPEVPGADRMFGQYFRPEPTDTIIRATGVEPMSFHPTAVMEPMTKRKVRDSIRPEDIASRLITVPTRHFLYPGFAFDPPLWADPWLSGIAENRQEAKKLGRPRYIIHKNVDIRELHMLEGFPALTLYCNADIDGYSGSRFHFRDGEPWEYDGDIVGSAREEYDTECMVPLSIDVRGEDNQCEAWFHPEPDDDTPEPDSCKLETVITHSQDKSPPNGLLRSSVRVKNCLYVLHSPTKKSRVSGVSPAPGYTEVIEPAEIIVYHMSLAS